MSRTSEETVVKGRQFKKTSTSQSSVVNVSSVRVWHPRIEKHASLQDRIKRSHTPPN